MLILKKVWCNRYKVTNFLIWRFFTLTLTKKQPNVQGGTLCAGGLHVQPQTLPSEYSGAIREVINVYEN